MFFDKEFLDATLPKTTEWLNALAEENERLKGEAAHYKLILMSLEEQAKRLSDIRSWKL